jgi:ribosomal protein S18 acetylase RimI-like enzyme
MSNAMYQAVCENFTEKVTYIAHLMPIMRVIEHRSFIATDCGLPSDTFNVIVVRDLSAPEHIIGAGLEHFMVKHWPMALWYWEDPVNTQGVARLISYGLDLTETHAAMVAEVTAARLMVPAPHGFMIKRVTDADELRQYGSVLAGLFGATDEGQQVRAYFDLLSRYPVNHGAALRSYIGIYDGTVVATGSLFVGHDTIGIYDIVTREQYRRRGIGSTMFAYLIDEAKQFQHRYAVLQASPDGIGIYRKAGFTPVGMVQTFENRALLNRV